MKNIRLVQSYSRILFNEARAKKSLSKIYNDFNCLVDLIYNSTNIKRFLSAPIYDKNTKNDLFKEVFADLKIHNIFLNFFSILLENNIINQIEDIHQDFRKLILKEEGKTLAKMVTAKKLSDQELDQFIKSYDKKLSKKFLVTHEVDPNIIAGSILYFENKICDMSVLNIQEKLRREIDEI